MVDSVPCVRGQDSVRFLKRTIHLLKFSQGVFFSVRAFQSLVRAVRATENEYTHSDSQDPL